MFIRLREFAKYLVQGKLKKETSAGRYKQIKVIINT